MKKVLFIAAVAALALVSCAKVENTLKTTGPGTPVKFGVYVPQTKAGRAGQMNTDSLKVDSLHHGGFGVFAYYTDDAGYSTSAKPNFMYNQGVFWNGSAWAYTPIKYWPNEFGTSATSAASDSLSFFAYAPYLTEAEFTTPGTYNITAKAPANNAAGDPKITYVVDPTPSTAVDLLWAVNGTTGLPWKNVSKQAVNGKVTFLFKHALARFNVNVRGYFDEVRSANGATSTDDVDANTKITIDSIEVSGSFFPNGILNLNNTTANKALWETTSAAATSLVIPNADIHESLRATVNGETTFPSVDGVTKTNVNVFSGAAPAKADSTYYTFIPKDTPTTLTVKITYYVTTKDDRLDGGISCVKNAIYKDITIDELENGKNYNLNIVLGMTTVKLEATVEAWDDPTDLDDIDLPVNLS
ncbi:MAG: fimbrillin family protein [Bacteroidales bacterium]|nr:fimbrillin family protein [Bacteroidales bacterium]